MAEYRGFENEQVTELALKYADRKFTHVVMRTMDDDLCPHMLSSMHESQEEAIKVAEASIKAYDDPEYQFHVCEIERSCTALESIIDGKKQTKHYHTFNLKRIN